MATLIQKAIDSLSSSIRKASRGTLSSYVLNAPPEYGQPLITPGDAWGLITPERMREVCRRTPTVAASMNAILDYCTNVDILIKNVDPAKPADARRVQIVDDLLDAPNDNDTKRQFLSALIWDLAILGFAAIEVEPNASGLPANLYVLDAARFKVDYDEHGTILGYDMLDAHGMPIRGPDGIHAWSTDQVIYFRRDPTSDSRYPLSRIQQLFSCAIIEDQMLAFIGGKFTESNIPYGIYSLGDVSETELKLAIANWNDQATSNHKIILTGNRGTPVWTQFGYALKELEATNLLAEVRRKIMAILGVTENELGESQDINKSNGYNLSYTFKRRAIEPVLNEITKTLTRRLIREHFNYKDIDLYYEEIDSRDELLQAQIDEINIKNGIYSPNHVANRKGLPSVPGGDDRFMLIGANVLPLDLIRRFAQAQLDAVEAEVAAMKAGVAQGGGVKPPPIRGPQPPIQTGTPDGKGSSAARISYPRVAPKSESPQQARGPKQKARNAGISP